MEPEILQEFEAKLDLWAGQGYQILADDIDGELRVTAIYTSSGGRSSEREQEFWPMAPEILQVLDALGVAVSRSLAGPRPWAGPHPDDWKD
jgi:hypothetical protein